MTLKLGIADVAGEARQRPIEPRKQIIVVLLVLKVALIRRHFTEIESRHNQCALCLPRLAVVGWTRDWTGWKDRPRHRPRPVRCTQPRGIEPGVHRGNVVAVANGILDILNSG